MKHLLTTALLCGVSVLAMQAQNVVITDKDGIPHKFNADYVQEITFEKIQTGDGYDFKFDTLNVNPWGATNINLEFKSGDNVVALDIYQPKAFFLQPGEYTVASNYADFTIDPGYSDIKINGNNDGLQSGNMTITQSGESYSFDMNLLLTSGQELKGTYTGELNIFGPTINFNLTGCTYAEMNDPAPNGFYYNFNDPNWKLEMRIELYSAGNAPAPGVYTFSNTMEDGTAASYVHLYSPYNEVTEFTEGTVTISGEGAETVVEIDGMLDLGIRMTAKYSGKLPSLAKNHEITFDRVFLDCYGKRNETLTLGNAEDTAIFDLYQPEAFFLQPGTYTVSDSNDDFTIDPNYSSVLIDGVQTKITGGSLTVSLEGDVYSFDGEVTFDGGSLKCSATGTLNVFGPSISFNLTGCNYATVNDPDPNGFYYKFNDENYKLEMRIDLFSEGDLPAPGVYTFSDTQEDGTASNYVDLYSPYNENTKFTEGTVTLSEDGNNTVIEIEGKLAIGITMTAKYSGKLPERK